MTLNEGTHLFIRLHMFGRGSNFSPVKSTQQPEVKKTLFFGKNYIYVMDCEKPENSKQNLTTVFLTNFSI